jgi:aspartate/tyrosine/aromatic aminotransferase
LKSGRISLAGLNEGNLDYVVEAFSDVTKAQ